MSARASTSSLGSLDYHAAAPSTSAQTPAQPRTNSHSQSTRSSGWTKQADSQGNLGISAVLTSPLPASFLPTSIGSLNPLRSTGGPRTTTTRGKPAAPIVLSDLPAVAKSDFGAYVSSISEEWSKWQQSVKASKERSLSANRLDSANVFNSQTSPVSPSHGKGKATLPPLDIVPDLYMQEDFDLTLPHTFDAVTERTDTPQSPSHSTPKRPKHTKQNSTMTLGDLVTDQMLQEKLSHYLDVVEVHLAQEIAVRSSSFFSALSNLQSLHAQSTVALDRAASLKRELSAVDVNTAQRGLAIVRASLRRRRLQEAARAVDRLKEVWKATEQAIELAESGEWEGSLGLVEEVDRSFAMSEVPSTGTTDVQEQQPIKLSRLTALRNLPDKLLIVRAQIGRSLQAELVSVLAHELEERIPEYTADGSWEAFVVKEKASERIRPLVRGLVRCRGSAMEDGVANWRTHVLGSIRDTIRQVAVRLIATHSAELTDR